MDDKRNTETHSEKATEWRLAKNSASEHDKAEYKKAEKELAKKVRNAKRKMEKDLVADTDKNNSSPNM